MSNILTPTQKIHALQQEIHTLRTELQHLRAKINPVRRGSATVRRAQRDAQIILMERYAGKPHGIMSMQEKGMSRARWGWAVALFRYAGVVAIRQKNWRYGLDWLVDDVEGALILLDNASLVTYRDLCRLRRQS